jgi:hypothetical protein
MKTIRRLTGFYFDPLLLHFHQGTFLSPVDLDEAAGDAHISRGRRWFPPPIFFRWPFRGLPCLSRVFSGRTLRGLSRLSRGFSGCTLLGPSRLSRVYRDALYSARPACPVYIGTHFAGPAPCVNYGTRGTVPLNTITLPKYRPALWSSMSAYLEIATRPQSGA